ncbi:hypothetical protein GGX14DRAFT_697865 [Mycena pura]|uniref:INO80 complex subunit B-like conserved region domain-containing protein n=1 Tax=Mycena pura TaxID=153505 RepID=A0AAD6VCL3_9AGAR|nr:hypothetical protein GGX14DRAFT_697865 [Mycena pura]
MVASEESEVDIEVADVHESGEDEEMDEEEDAGQDELDESDNEQADGSQSWSPRPQPAPGRVPPLTIKLKFGAQPERRAPVRRYAYGRGARNEDIESEDSDSDEDDAAPRSKLHAGPSSGRQLTARQAALANAVDPSHVSLGASPQPSDVPSRGLSAQGTATEGAAPKKRGQSPSQIALRKEENARKRKNMIAETINRLLKKQSRAKTRRNAAAPVPTPVTVTAPQSDEDAADMDDEREDAPPAPSTSTAAAIPMYRWISTSRPPEPAAPPDAMCVDSEPAPPPVASISFSIPEAFLSTSGADESAARAPCLPTPAHCAIEGCEGARKYRAVGKAWGVGACGLGHLRLLQGNA